METAIRNFFQNKESVTKLVSNILMLALLAPIIMLIIGQHNRFIFYALMFIPGVLGLLIGLFYIETNKLNLKKIIKDKKNLPIIFLSIFFLVTFVASLMAKDKSSAFFGDEYRKEGLITYFSYIGYFVLGMFNKNSSKYFNVMLIVSTILSTVSLITYMADTTKPIISAFFNANHYGYYLVITTILALTLFMQEKACKNKIIYLVIYSLNLIVLIYNDTFGSFLGVLAGLIVALVYYLSKKDKLIFIPVIVLVCLSLVCEKNNQNIILSNFHILNSDTKQAITNLKLDELTYNELKIGSMRGELWHITPKFIADKPFIGYGLDNLQSEYIRYHSYISDRPHNIFLYILATSGFIGAIFFFSGYFMILLKPLLKFIKKQSISEKEQILFFIIGSYFISSLFGNTMFYTTPYIIVFLGMLFKK